METEKKEAAKNNIGRLCLKLKINTKPDHDDMNKLKSADHQEEEVEDEDEELPFVCQVCNKQYKSGKALGGHKRMHNLPPKDNNKLKKNNNTPLFKHNNKRKANDEAEQDEDEPVCPLCEKSFPSMKSLFGHMRSHPDRGWRGIQPPYSWSSSVIKQGSSMITSDDYHMKNDEDDDSPAATPKRRPRAQKPSSSDSPKTPPPTSGDDHKEDLTKSLKDGNWYVTAKRGSGNSTGCSSAASSFVDLMDNRTKEAVIDLMLLAHQKPRSEFLSALNQINKNEGQIRENEEDKEEEEEEEEEEKEENSVEEDYIVKKIKNNNKGKKRRKKMKLADLEEEEGGGGEQVIPPSTSNKAKLPSRSSNGGQYVCSVCKRSFPSYQALGGHRSSHNKTTTTTRKKNIIIDDHLSSSDDDDNDDSSLSTDETATTDHDKDDDGDDQVPSQKLDSKISLDFDLNELPPSED